MKFLKQLLAVVLLSSSLGSSVYAYGLASYLPKTQTLFGADLAGGVTVHNTSYDSWNDIYPDYNVYATFYPTMQMSSDWLGPYGSYYDSLFYPIYFPNDHICFQVETNTYPPITAFDGCGSYGDTLIITYTNVYLNAADKSGVKKAVGEMVKAKK